MGRRLLEDIDARSEWGSCFEKDCSSASELWTTFLLGHWGQILIVMIIFIIIVIGWRYLKKRRTKMEREEIIRHMMDGADIKKFKFGDIKKATKHFSYKNVIGRGGLGEVYKGLLLGDIEVAIKKSMATDEKKLAEFRHEIAALSQIRHPNIVILIGCCYHRRYSYLLYEFFPKGDLYQLLHEKEKDKESTVATPWSLRYNIAVKLAEALTYLHFRKVWHRDIKARNVLLDNDNNPKLADFGICKCFSLDTSAQREISLVQGTLGYMCPEYALDGEYNASCDTFSFGVLLAELLTGLNSIVFTKNSEPLNLFTYFASLAPTNLDGILDPELNKEDEKSLDMMRGVASIACKCVVTSRKKRPTMLSVWTDLKQLETSAPPDNYEINKDEVSTTEQLETSSSSRQV